jgi:hypothetical protein
MQKEAFLVESFLRVEGVRQKLRLAQLFRMTELAKYNSTASALWKGFIMLEVEIAASDVSSKDIPDAAFVCASRYSYLPVVLAEIVDHYRESAVEFSSDVWFECAGLPLWWYVCCLKSTL